MRVSGTGKGRLWPSESRWLRDEATGARIRQVTAHPSIHHHPFFFVPPYDDAMRRLVFVSHRIGRPQLFAEERLADFGDAEMRERGMVGAAMGTTTVSRDDRWWAVPVKLGKVSRLVVIDTGSGAYRVILERDTVGHLQFCPDDSSLIFYAGALADRLWLVNRDGTGTRRLWQREHRDQWLTHESWLAGRRELAFIDWPNGLRAIQVDTGELRWITRFPAWHEHPDDTGSWFACDTNFPDIGLHRFPAVGNGAPERLCLSRASSVGAHWGGRFPYNDGPREVYAPQHTHPHPRPSPDGRRVLYTSDASGYAQLYECHLE